MRKSTVTGLIALMRPRQWVKNGFVLAPLVFSGAFLDSSAVFNVLMAVLLFCVASSATYILNDIRDVEQDRKHPKKCKIRPLASGIVEFPQAVSLLIALYGILIAGYFFEPGVIYIILAYLLLNIAYTFGLKHQPVIDIFIIAIGFVLRVYAGAVAISVPVSAWMFATTFCLALFLAAIKRRQELALTDQSGRKVLEYYSVTLVERYAEMAATGALIFYSLFVMSARPEMVATIPFVLFGLFRYWFIVESQDAGESPTDVLLSDWQLIITVVLWIVVAAWITWPAPG